MCDTFPSYRRGCHFAEGQRQQKWLVIFDVLIVSQSDLWFRHFFQFFACFALCAL